MDRLLLIDGNNLINRAFYALPPLRSNSGELCNAVYGFVNALLATIERVKPKYLAVMFDLGAPTFRHRMYDMYKANRHKMPQELADQLPLVKKMLKIMGVTILEQSGIEADDIIGTVSSNVGKDVETVILSGDKDLLQLIDDKTHVYLPIKGVGEARDVCMENMVEVYGVRADQVVSLKALMGDSSDNIPGVAGVGEKTAIGLITQYDSLDGVYASLELVTGKLKDKLSADKDKAYMSYALAKIDTNCGVEIDLSQSEFTLPLDNDVRKVFEEYNFKSLLSKSALFDAKIEEKTEKNIKIIQKYVEIPHDMDALVRQVCKTGCVAVSTDGMLWHLSIGDGVEHILSGSIINSAAGQESYQSIISDASITKIVYDAKEYMHSFGHIDAYYDVSLAMYLYRQSDKVLSQAYAIKSEGLDEENIASSIYEMYLKYDYLLSKNDQQQLYLDIELPLVRVLYHMEKAGVKIDKLTLRELSAKYEEELKLIRDRIYAMAGYEFNINSPLQMGELLFVKLQLKHTGKKGTSIDVLEEIEDQHPIVSELIRYRKVYKLLSTYLIDFAKYIGADGKVHTTYMQMVTSTGRLASRNPNLQNIPVRDEESKALRKMFVSSFGGGSIISADYNQIELRLMAHFSGDDKMIDAFNRGQDIHKSMACEIFDVPMSEVTSAQRRVAKMVNFGIIYGISQYGLAKNLGIKNNEAKDIIERYFTRFSSVKQCMNDNISAARETGYSQTMYGRRRNISELNSSNPMVKKFGERVAINTPLQGTASDIIKIAMLKVAQALDAMKLKSKLILQIHDELIIDAAADEVDIVQRLLRDNMDNVTALKVPLIVDVGAGANWLECK